MTIKTALSIPKDQFNFVERNRKALGLSRSAFFQKLIASWSKRLEEERLIEIYLEGYRRNPEDSGELKAMSLSSAEAFKSEGLV